MKGNSESTKENDCYEEELEMTQLNSLCHDDGPFSADQDGKSSVGSCEVNHSHARTDHRFREILMCTICLYIAKFMQGWSQALFGPSYIDLRMISSTDLASGSWILTSRFIGSTIGSTIQGVLAGRWNSKLVFGSSMIGSCIAFAVIPWCSNLTAMITGHVVLGVGLGIYASGISADIYRIWGKKSRLMLFGTQLMISLGSALAPLVSAPFLVDHTTELLDTSSVNYNGTVMISTNQSSTGNAQSEIYIPFSITSVMTLLSGLFFFVLYIICDRKNASEVKKAYDVTHPVRKIPRPLKLFIIQLFGAIFFIHAGVNEVLPGFLATYCVELFHWSKKNGALISFLFFLFSMIAQVFGIAINKWINTIIYTTINFCIVFLSILGMVIISLLELDMVAWFLMSVLGFAKGVLFSMIFSWTNDYITPVTGKISGFYYICLMMGATIHPIIFGYVMENIGLIWFCYVLLIESIVMIVFVVIAIIATRYVVNHFGRPIEKTVNFNDDDNKQ